MSSTENLYESVEPIAVLRKRFLSLTEGNYCAAFILDRFVATIASREEEALFDREPTDYRIKISIASITDKLFGMFTQQDVFQALNLLITKHYIHDRRECEGSENYSTFIVDRNRIDQDSDIYCEKINQARQEIQAHQEILAEKSDEIAKLLQQRERESKSSEHNRNENKRVEYHRNRASRVGLSATLTTAQWTKTLEHYHKHCAFCIEGDYQVLEHFIPLIHGGGTTEYNCVPACAKCNRLKSDMHPSMVPSELSLFKNLKDIQKYLEMRRLDIDQKGGE